MVVAVFNTTVVPGCLGLYGVLRPLRSCFERLFCVVPAGQGLELLAWGFEGGGAYEFTRPALGASWAQLQVFGDLKFSVGFWGF